MTDVAVERCEARRGLCSLVVLTARVAGDVGAGEVVEGALGTVLRLRLLGPKMPKDLLSEEAELRLEVDIGCGRSLSLRSRCSRCSRCIALRSRCSFTDSLLGSVHTTSHMMEAWSWCKCDAPKSGVLRWRVA
jgi:hypothetical protein